MLNTINRGTLCMTVLQQDLPQLTSLPQLIRDYITTTLNNVVKDEADPEEWWSVVEPILSSCGWSDQELRLFKDSLQTSILADYKYEERNEEVVPFETPVQMSSNLMDQSGGAKAGVRLDWLSSRKVLASRVDRTRMEKLEARIRQRKEKRGLLQSDPSSVTTVSSTLEVVKQPTVVDQAAIDKAILQDLLDTCASSDTNTTRSRDIKIDDFDISIGGKRILTNASLTVAFGRRYGLIGRNGIGKSTLLRHLAARQLPVPMHLTILHVEQEIVGDDTPAITSVLQSDRRRILLLEESSKPDISPDRLALVHRRLAELGADEAESRAATILNGLGFSPSDQLRPTRTFSGGWRMRIALARALFCQPDILLLDEPTNMLDIPAVTWLEEYLQSWSSTLIVVSHDRYFLDSVATDILHVHDEILDAYRGNYSQFVVTREERLRNAQREYDSQLAYRQSLQAFVDRWRCSAARAAQAQSRLKILEKLPELVPVVVDPPVVFRFPACEPLSPPIVSLSGVSFKYNSDSVSMILSNVDFTVEPKARVAIVGPNGAGKSTLLKLMLGHLDPTNGQVNRNGRLRVGYFSQHHVDQLNTSMTPLEEMLSRFEGKTEEECRRALGAFGITGPLALQTIKTLSGGQKSRVSFACIAFSHPHLLILDEPTNHLDMDSIDALIVALSEFGGAVVAVSHDKRFVDALCDQIWVCKESSLRRFDGTIMDYSKSLLSS